jgi:hypothetical protein
MAGTWRSIDGQACMTGVRSTVKTMAAKILRRLGFETWSLLLFAQSGGLRLIPVPWILPVRRALDGYGLLGAATVITAARDHNGVALIDERGALSYGDLDNRTNALANEWRRRGLGPVPVWPSWPQTIGAFWKLSPSGAHSAASRRRSG